MNVTFKFIAHNGKIVDFAAASDHCWGWVMKIEDYILAGKEVAIGDCKCDQKSFLVAALLIEFLLEIVEFGENVVLFVVAGAEFDRIVPSMDFVGRLQPVVFAFGENQIQLDVLEISETAGVELVEAEVVEIPMFATPGHAGRMWLNERAMVDTSIAPALTAGNYAG